MNFIFIFIFILILISIFFEQPIWTNHPRGTFSFQLKERERKRLRSRRAAENRPCSKSRPSSKETSSKRAFERKGLQRENRTSKRLLLQRASKGTATSHTERERENQFFKEKRRRRLSLNIFFNGSETQSRVVPEHLPEGEPGP